MRSLLILLSLMTGIVLGLFSTYIAAVRGITFDGIMLGGWQFVPRAGAPDMDPYRRAHLFSRGELPLASGEGYTLLASTDHQGQPLDGTCHYQLTGPTPHARFWTLALTTNDGLGLIHPTERTSFTSAQIIREQGGKFSIQIGPRPLAGNWLPSPDGRPFLLMFRFYETPLSASATVLDARIMPVLTRVECPA